MIEEVTQLEAMMQVTIKEILTIGFSVGGFILTGFGTLCMFILKGITSELKSIRKELAGIRDDASEQWKEIGTISGIVRTLPCRSPQSAFLRELKDDCSQKHVGH